jgi:hypothetical protein
MNMKECDNSKICTSNFLLYVCLLIMLDTFITRTITTLQHFTTLHPTSPNYFTTLIDTSLPLIHTSLPSY